MKKPIDEFIQQFCSHLPPQLQDMKREFEEEFRKGLTLAIQKLQLVSREEFDIQTQVLLKTREKLERLERMVSELEKKDK